MLDAENPGENQTAESTAPAEAPAADAPPAEGTAKKAATKKTTAKKAPAKKTAAKKSTTKKAAAKKSADTQADTPGGTPAGDAGTAALEPDLGQAEPPAKKAATKKSTAKTAAKKTAKRTTKKAASSPDAEPGTTDAAASSEGSEQAAEDSTTGAGSTAIMPLFKAPEATKPKKRAATKRATGAEADTAAGDTAAGDSAAGDTAAGDSAAGDTGERSSDEGDRPRTRQGQKNRSAGDSEKSGDEGTSQAADEDRDRATDDDSDSEEGGNRRRRRRGGRRRRKSGDNDSENGTETNGHDDQSGGSDRGGNGRGSNERDGSERGGSDSDGADESGSPSSRRRRRRRRTGDDGDAASNDPQNTVTKVRKPRSAEDEITALSGSTRLEAKKQRRREGREAGRRRAPIVSEAEFLARREAVERVMVIRQHKDLTQIAVLEDKVLVEHYVARESQTSLIGNVYLGRVQNVLPSMEAAFIDIGKGRNAVLYAGEVNWDSLGAKNGQPRKIESVLKSGQSVLVQVSKDPIGHKGARLTSQISLPGRFLVYVPDGTTSGISRKLPDTERNRLKTLLKEIVPDSAGVIVRTAAEGASEDELTRDVERLKARWEDIESKVSGGNAPQLLYGEPDLTLKVVRDLFTEDFDKLVVSGDEAWEMVDDYVKHLAPDLEERLDKYDGGQDVFAAYRIDEQIAKGLDRKVWLPSGGSLVIDRTEAMTVVDVNTGKFTGSGGNLEETVTKNNLEAAEEIVRQLRLRDIGGIIVVDFIDMVLESNRDLVLRRMVECLGRDRTRHQVAEVTSLGLVQMTRKRIGTGLLEAFSESCEHCAGRGLIVHHEPVEPKKKQDDEPRRNRRSGRSRGRDDNGDSHGNGNGSIPSPKDLAAMARADRPEQADRPEHAEERVDRAGSQAEGDGSQAGASDVPDEPRGTRSSRRQGGRRDRPALIDDVDEGAPDVDAGEPVTADKPVADEAVDDYGAAPTEVAPKRAATTRKRSARRAQGPAGEATVLTAEEIDRASAPVEVAPGGTDDQPASDQHAEQPAQAEAVAEPVQPVPVDAPAPAAPAVVASVRRRGAARRPAGPPSGATAETPRDSGGDSGGVSGDGVAPGEPGELSADVEEPAAAVHVPVKKKGSRKR